MRGEIAEDKFPEFVVVGRAVDVGEELDMTHQPDSNTRNWTRTLI